MAYTDSLQVRYFNSTSIGVGTGIIFDADSDHDAVRCPTGCQLEAFGVHISGPGTVTGSPQYLVSIGKSLADGSPAPQGTITIPVTGIPLVLGARFECGSVGGRAINILPGQYVRVSQTLAGTGTGAVEPYVVLRINGYTGQKPGLVDINPSSPLVVVFS